MKKSIAILFILIISVVIIGCSSSTTEDQSDTLNQASDSSAEPQQNQEAGAQGADEIPQPPAFPEE